MSQLPPLNTETIWSILNEELEDDLVNQLVWHYLGYRRNSETNQWDTTAVAPDWVSDYPEPPNFIESRPATVKLTRSINKENKQLLKEYLGFKGYKINELNPRRTRRATAANWLLSAIKQQQQTD
ncbi:MAG: DUF1823 family protein [Microcoleaceae cyanobacterium]